MKKIAILTASLLLCAAAFAQQPTIRWKVSAEQTDAGKYSIVFTGKIADGIHTYGLEDRYSPTSAEFGTPEGYEFISEAYELSEAVMHDGMPVFYNEIIFARDIRLIAPQATVRGELSWLGCTETSCFSPEYQKFEVRIESADGAVPDAPAASSAPADGIGAGTGEISETPQAAGGRGFSWAVIIEAILWGFAALLTPCVFPMVPMTVSFFMKGSGNPAAGRFKAAMYGLSIVLLYTVPVSLIILATRIIGGEAVTADIFNWLATHWLPNIIFFIVFMAFAASFFGAFEITLPSSLVNKSDRGADKGGMAGIFFMALTLVLVSFSCTGPIVGSVLIKATQGQFWEPMAAMLAFSAAFALPFTLLAFFPSLLKNLPKSGGWLNSVKVVLGFIEIALGLKFLSVADQTYHWGILDREIYLAIWITVFFLLGMYLLGKIRFAHDDAAEHIGVGRLALAIAAFSFAVYMIPGMFGAPLKGLSGYLPPLSSQDFVLGGSSSSAGEPQREKSEYDLSLPHGLHGYFSLEEGLEAAMEAGKPVFVDITGHGCVNCREMEARVWSDPQVLDILRNDYIIVALYTDDKQKLAEKDRIVTENGDVLKTLGRANSYIVRKRFGVNAQPNYVLLSPDGRQLAPVRGYDLSIPGFIEFLRSGLSDD